MSRRLVLVSAGVVIAALIAAALGAASPTVAKRAAARHMLVGLQDDAQIVGNPDKAFPLLKALRVQVVRVQLTWGGRGGVAAKKRPANPTDPEDPAYNWAGYDRVVTEAAKAKIKVLFTIFGVPGWANGGKQWNRAPKNFADLQRFAYAAAKRYSGTYKPENAETLPAVKLWLAWNEPNNPNFIFPQLRGLGHGRVRVESARTYVKICNAVYTGVHLTLIADEKVACGGTSPRGNNNVRNSRPSTSPLVFVRNLKKYGLRKFDAYAHHPYSNPNETPTTRPKKTAVTFGNLNDLIREVTRLWGAKRIWITEYGYQTKPPDPTSGVTWAKQARYLKQAYGIARKNPRIDLMIWFMLRDEPRSRAWDGWQSGFFTYGGKKKPSYSAFQHLPH